MFSYVVICKTVCLVSRVSIHKYPLLVRQTTLLNDINCYSWYCKQFGKNQLSWHIIAVDFIRGCLYKTPSNSSYEHRILFVHYLRCTTIMFIYLKTNLIFVNTHLVQKVFSFIMRNYYRGRIQETKVPPTLIVLLDLI